MTYVSLQTFFRQKFTRTPLQLYFSKILSVVPLRYHFDEQIFLMKHMSFDLVLGADSEYDIDFAWK
jgi:hypothetical protein